MSAGSDIYDRIMDADRFWFWFKICALVLFAVAQVAWVVILFQRML